MCNRPWAAVTLAMLDERHKVRRAGRMRPKMILTMGLRPHSRAAVRLRTIWPSRKMTARDSTGTRVLSLIQSPRRRRAFTKSTPTSRASLR
jgi:hypothetical protein